MSSAAHRRVELSTFSLGFDVASFTSMKANEDMMTNTNLTIRILVFLVYPQLGEREMLCEEPKRKTFGSRYD